MGQKKSKEIPKKIDEKKKEKPKTIEKKTKFVA
jgi:hypothetical protein